MHGTWQMGETFAKKRLWRIHTNGKWKVPRGSGSYEQTQPRGLLWSVTRFHRGPRERQMANIKLIFRLIRCNLTWTWLKKTKKKPDFWVFLSLSWNESFRYTQIIFAWMSFAGLLLVCWFNRGKEILKWTPIAMWMRSAIVVSGRFQLIKDKITKRTSFSSIITYPPPFCSIWIS